jgi:hypothetical protein
MRFNFGKNAFSVFAFFGIGRELLPQQLEMRFSVRNFSCALFIMGETVKMDVCALMTLEEFFEEVDLAPLILILAVSILVFRLLAGAMKKREVECDRKAIYGLEDSGWIISENEVKIVEKSVVPYRVGRQSQKTITNRYSGPAAVEIPVNWCVFETKSGERIRLAIESNERFDLMVIGDVGTLDYVGRRFIQFKK